MDWIPVKSFKMWFELWVMKIMYLDLTRNNSDRMEDLMFPIPSMTHKTISQPLYKQVQFWLHFQNERWHNLPVSIIWVTRRWNSSGTSACFHRSLSRIRLNFVFRSWWKRWTNLLAWNQHNSVNTLKRENWGASRNMIMRRSKS